MRQRGWIAPADMREWIAHYAAAVTIADAIPHSSIQLALNASTVVSSNTPRALSSLQALGIAPTITDGLFAETGLPYALWRFPRLPAAGWAVFFRLLWFAGYSQNSESLLAARIRARSAARQLVALAEQGPVLLMGHGIMNRLIAAELTGQGWSSPTQYSNRYWAGNVFHDKKQ